MFAFTMIFSGRMQDKIGPRITIYIGGVLISVGALIAALSTSYVIWILGFGVLIGGGIGFCYSAITPVTIKWFSPDKTGLVTGVVVAGFGLSSVYLAPLFTTLIRSFALQGAMIYYAIGFAILMAISTYFLKNPVEIVQSKNTNNLSKGKDIELKEVLKQFSFYQYWVLFFIASGAGLMVISFITEMVKKGLGEQAFIGVIIIAIGNASGRVISGYLSDRIGRMKTLLMMLLFQTVLMYISAYVSGMENFSIVLLLLVATFIGFNYGSNLTLFPSIAKDNWGLKNFGANYGMLFTAWGIGGFVLSRVSQMLKASTGSFQYSFLLAGILLTIASVITIFAKKD